TGRNIILLYKLPALPAGLITNMKKILLKSFFGLLFLVMATCIFYQYKNYTEDQQVKILSLKKKKPTHEEKSAFNQARARYEFDMLKDPGTNRMPENIRLREFSLARILPSKEYGPVSGIQGTENLNNYVAAGPNNIGGRTRALAYDLRFNNTTKIGRAHV